MKRRFRSRLLLVVIALLGLSNVAAICFGSGAHKVFTHADGFIILDSTGVPILLDFGLARAAFLASGPSTPTRFASTRGVIGFAPTVSGSKQGRAIAGRPSGSTRPGE